MVLTPPVQITLPPPGCRRRRKFVRFDGGKASNRRICSMSERSDSRGRRLPEHEIEIDGGHWRT
jgi:hypothetical protein